MQLDPGTQLDRYVIQGTLGEGAMAVVYRAQHIELGSLHALKKLKIPGEKVNERLLLEGRLQSSLKHPNVVSVTDLITIDGVPALVMEFVAGPTLASLLQAKRLSIHQCDAIVRDLLKGIAAAHAHGLIHRDLKPHNILMAVTDDSLVPKVADFGLAKVVEGEADPRELTRTGMAMGTPAYMAPEQIRDSSNVDNRADVFSLGAILYEIVTGTPCFRGDNIMEIWEKICAGDYPSVQEVAPDVPARMAMAIEGALQIDLEERTESVSSLYKAWCADEEGVHVPIPGRTSLDFWPEDIRSAAASMAPTLEQSSPRATAHDSNTYAFMADDEASPPSLAADSSSSIAEQNDSSSSNAPPASPPPDRRGSLLLAIGVGAVLSVLAFSALVDKEGTPEAAVTTGAAPPPVPTTSTSTHSPEAATMVDEPPPINGGLLMPLANLGSAASTTESAPQFAGISGDSAAALHAIFEIDPDDAAATEQAAAAWLSLQEEVGEEILDLGYLMRSHSTQPLKDLRKAVETLRTQQPRQLAWSLLEVGSLKNTATLQETLVAAENGLQHHPDRAELRLSLASALIHLKRYSEARPHLERLLRSEASADDARTLLGRIAIQRGEEAERLEHFMLALSDTVPLVDQVRFLRRHGLDLAATGQVQEAEKVWDFCMRTANEASEFDQALRCAAAALENALWIHPVSEWAPWQDAVRDALSHPAVDPDLKQVYSTFLMATEALAAIRKGELEQALGLSRQLASLTPEQNPLDPARSYAAEVRREIAIAQRNRDELNKFVGPNVGTWTLSPYSETCTYQLNQARVFFALDDHDQGMATAQEVLKGRCAWDRHQPISSLYLSAEVAAHHLARGNPAAALPLLNRAEKDWPEADDTLPIVRLLGQLRQTAKPSTTE